MYDLKFRALVQSTKNEVEVEIILDAKSPEDMREQILERLKTYDFSGSRLFRYLSHDMKEIEETEAHIRKGKFLIKKISEISEKDIF
jgi:hypothetical protein